MCDGIGMQAFAVVASRQRLPPYAEWTKAQGRLEWPHQPPVKGVVWRGEKGKVGETTMETRSERVGTSDRKELSPLYDVLRKLEASRDVEAVTLLAFPIDKTAKR